MEQEIIGLIAKNCGIENWQAENTLKLIEEGATVPFISRYRKERTGNLDEVQIGVVADALDKIKALKERKEAIIKNIEKQGKLTDELKARISKSWDPVEVEDIYAPFKRKTKTRAESAREAGLEPLAKRVFTVTGTLTAFTTAFTISSIRGIFCKSPAPAPLPAIFFTGHPQFMSMTSGFAVSAIRAASAIVSGSRPYI